MATVTSIPFYRSVSLKKTPGMDYGFYIMCYEKTNHLILGTYAVSADGLQRTHMAGPLIHFAHANLFAEWLYDEEHSVVLVDKVLEGSTSLAHPFSSNGEPIMLQTQTIMALAFGKFWELVGIGLVENKRIQQNIADAIIACRNAIRGNPVAEETTVISLGDGRFSWVNYDDTLDIIRMGFGAFDPRNEPQFGPTNYVLDRSNFEPFAAYHIEHPDEPIAVTVRPAFWRPEFALKIWGDLKCQTALEILKLAAKVWNS